MVTNPNTFPSFLRGGGETGSIIRSINWEGTLPADYYGWPANLGFSLGLLLNAKNPMFLLWGEDHTLFYNDAYIPAFESNGLHSWAMGKPAKEVWGESWRFIEPDLKAAIQGAEDELPEGLFNRGARQPKDTCFTYHLNPIKDLNGNVDGILVICNETISTAAREQLQTQRRLEQLNQEITHLFNSINEGFYSKDTLRNQYLNLSAGCPKIYGYTIREFFSNPNLWAEVIHPDDKERVFRDDIDLRAGKQTLTEYRIIHKTGAVKWIEVKAIPVLKDGILVRVDGIVNDISARKTAEFETLKQKELSDTIINSLPGIFYLYDETGRFLKWNRNFETVAGYTTMEVAAMHPLNFFVEEQHTMVWSKIEEVFQKGESVVEALFKTRTGKTIPYYFTGRTIVYEGRLCLLGTGIDISQRVEIQETLQKSEAMLSSVLNSIPQAIFWKDTNSIYTGCNIVFAKAAGFSDTSFINGKSDFELPWELEESEKYRIDDREVIDNKESKIHIIETQRQADGQKIWIDTTKIPLIDSNGNVYGILGIYDDISERKRAEEERERMTLDLIEKNINLKQFSYIVSHNLRSPINKIMGLASLLKMPAMTDEQKSKLVEYIENETNNLDNVVKDLTTIISFQDLGVNVKEEINIAEEVRLIKESLEQEIQEAGATIKCEFSEAPKFKSVKGYFYSILYNLITNAIKYRSVERPLEVDIRSFISGTYLCISVSDNGSGIDLEKHQDDLFTLYSRFHSGDIPGKGMGLNLVKTQAETLGGKVELESKPGKGTTFRIYFLID